MPGTVDMVFEPHQEPHRGEGRGAERESQGPEDTRPGRGRGSAWLQSPQPALSQRRCRPPIPLAVGAVGRGWPGWESCCHQQGSGYRHPGPLPQAQQGLPLASGCPPAPRRPLLAPSSQTPPPRPPPLTSQGLGASDSPSWAPPRPGPAHQPSPPPSQPLVVARAPTPRHRTRPRAGPSGHQGFPGAVAPGPEPGPSPHPQCEGLRACGRPLPPGLLPSQAPPHPKPGVPLPGSSCTPLPGVVARPAHSCAGSVSVPAVGGGRWTPGLPSAVGSFEGGGGRWGEWGTHVPQACLPR